MKPVLFKLIILQAILDGACCALLCKHVLHSVNSEIYAVKMKSENCCIPAESDMICI